MDHKEGALNIGQHEDVNIKELRVKHDQTNCDLRPLFLGTPLLPPKLVGRGSAAPEPPVS